MPNKLWIALLALSSFAAAPWPEATAKLTPGTRVEVQHGGKIDRGLYALATATELVLSTKHAGQLVIPQSEIERVTALGSEAPGLSYFASMRNQLFPQRELIYDKHPQ